MNTPVTAKFTCSRDEYVLAMRRHFIRSALHVKRDLVGGLLAIGGGLYLSRATDIGWLGWILAAAGLILLAVVAYAMLLMPRMIYASQPKLKDEYVLSFSDDGIHFRTDGVDATLQWSLYHKWLSDEQFYIMYHGKRDLSVIPRRALIHDDADEKLRQLLTAHIGRPES
jgi:hypothetical protein